MLPIVRAEPEEVFVVVSCNRLRNAVKCRCIQFRHLALLDWKRDRALCRFEHEVACWSGGGLNRGDHNLFKNTVTVVAKGEVEGTF